MYLGVSTGLVYENKYTAFLDLAQHHMHVLLACAAVRRNYAMNSMTDGSIKTEPLPPVLAMQRFNLATAATARFDYKAAIDGFQAASDLYLKLMERDFRVDYVKRVAECLMGAGTPTARWAT